MRAALSGLSLLLGPALYAGLVWMYGLHAAPEIGWGHRIGGLVVHLAALVLLGILGESVIENLVKAVMVSPLLFLPGYSAVLGFYGLGIFSGFAVSVLWGFLPKQERTGPPRPKPAAPAEPYAPPPAAEPVPKRAPGPKWLRTLVAGVQLTVTFVGAPLIIVLHLKLDVSLWWLLAVLALNGVCMALRDRVDGGP